MKWNATSTIHLSPNTSNQLLYCAIPRSSRVRDGLTALWKFLITDIYEFKPDGTAVEALAQIEDKGYAESYTTDSRKVLRVDARFSSATLESI